MEHYGGTLLQIITCGTLLCKIIPEIGKGLYIDPDSAHVKEVVIASREGGASLNILSGFIAGNFSAYAGWVLQLSY